MHGHAESQGESGRIVDEPTIDGDSRCTPEAIWRVALEALGIEAFDVDVASNPFSTVPAHVAYYGRGPGDDGLALPWFGHAWENPPFSRMGPWVAHAIAQAHRADTITALVPGDTSTAWWRALSAACVAWAVWPGRPHFPLAGELAAARQAPKFGVHLFLLGRLAPVLVGPWWARMEIAGAHVFPRGGPVPVRARARRCAPMTRARPMGRPDGPWPPELPHSAIAPPSIPASRDSGPNGSADCE